MSARRLQYLKAMGVDVWVDRSRPPEVQAERALHPGVVDIAPTEPARALAEPPPPPPPPHRGPAARTPPRAPAPPPINDPQTAPIALRELPRDWAALKETVRSCQACKLCGTRSQTVFGVGPEAAPLMIVGEGPGADEDAQGEPFVGRAGKLLDEMLRAIGRSRQSDTYIANVVKCRPPGNRDPEPDEVEACRPYLDRQLEQVQPRLIVALGRVAAQRLLQTDAPLSRLRGPLHAYGPQKTPLIITYHPAYLLRSPREKAKSWEDLKRIHQFLAGP
jgi:DNA polymerase